jgi:hypothetical protein
VAHGTTTSSLEGPGIEQELVVEDSLSLRVSPPAGVESWSLLEYEKTWSSRVNAASEDGSIEGELRFAARWEGTLDPAWPADSGFEFERIDASGDVSRRFASEQCEVTCVNEVCTVF